MKDISLISSPSSSPVRAGSKLGRSGSKLGRFGSKLGRFGSKLGRGGPVIVGVVIIAGAVVATVLITKKVKKDNRQRRAKLKKLKKYKKLRARAEIEYAHRHMPSKWRNRVRSSADTR
jgi:hypothetical protein